MKAWLTLTLVACGVPGPTGPQGPPGAAPTGSQLTGVKTVFECGKIDTQKLKFQYRGARFDDGSLFVSCAISDQARTYSATSLFLDSTSGSNTGVCILTYDLESDNGGFWLFSMNTIRSATYVDATSSKAGTTILFSAADCAEATN